VAKGEAREHLVQVGLDQLRREAVLDRVNVHFEVLVEELKDEVEVLVVLEVHVLETELASGGFKQNLER
jgi:hypothetical protein